MLVTFSGLDGSGKSTLLSGLADDLRAAGHRTTTLRMFDISLYSYLRRMRDAVRRTTSDATRPAGPAPLGSGPLYDLARHRTTRRLGYLGDIVSLLWWRTYHSGLRREILLMDRYLYDLLVDAAGEGWPDLSIVLGITPRPDVPIYVDVPPERAFSRKREFDIPYLTRRRECYQWIFAKVSDPLIIDNEDLDGAAASVRNAVFQRLE